MATFRESVLYYNPSANTKTAQVKGVLVRMGIRIRNISPDQAVQTVGYLAGLDGFEEQPAPRELPVMDEEILVMLNFTSSRIDELLMQLRKARIPKIELKAVVTETNCKWTFYKLYQEIKEEHDTLQKKDE